MKRTHTPPSLKWLITKKAKISGEINVIEKMLPAWLPYSKASLEAAEDRIIALKENYNKNLSLEKKLPKLKSQLEAIEIALTLHEIQIDTKLITPAKTNKKMSYGPHGSMTRGIYECLKMSGKPTMSKEITSFLIARNGIDMTRNKFVDVRYAVVKRLGTLALEGKIERLHALTGNGEGIWKIPS